MAGSLSVATTAVSSAKVVDMGNREAKRNKKGSENNCLGIQLTDSLQNCGAQYAAFYHDLLKI
jgi:hypothetical protein